jgi:threonine/homoserine/homoserine lactone efflux protein
MTLEPWLAFVAATCLMLLIPGPTVTLVVGYALAQGRAKAVAMACGVALADFTAMTLSLAGLGAILAASATLFTVVKLAGGAYLVWLGWKLWHAPVAAQEIATGQDTPPWRMFVHAYAVTALNPKSIVFFVAFVPQFIDKTAPYMPQVVILIATFVTMAFCNVMFYALVASRARVALGRPHILRWINRAGGGILMTAGASAAVMRTSN